jgi:hypothetical protein
MKQYVITFYNDDNQVVSSVIDADSFTDAIHTIDWQIPEEQMISIVLSPHKFGRVDENENFMQQDLPHGNDTSRH